MEDKNPPKQFVSIYYDQNILDFFIKGFFDQENFITIPDCLVIPVFSDITIVEILRIENEESREKFLEYLDKRDFYHISIDYENDAAKLIRLRAKEMYEQIINESGQFAPLEEAFLDLTHSFIGGEDALSPAENMGKIIDCSFNMLKEVLEDVSEDVVFPDEISNQIDALKMNKNQMKEAFYDIFPSSGETDEALKRIKEEFDIDPQKLNNISPEDAVINIWKLIQPKLTGSFHQHKKIEDFLQSIYQGNEKTPWTSMHLISSLYNALNYFGYWQDRRLVKKNKFIPSYNDSRHAYHASYSDVFVTRDKRFAKKLKAVYVYLGINTRVIHIGTLKET